MQSPLVECVPNFSEARRPEVVDQILAAIQSVPGVLVLDRSSDLDHNRTVVTFVGAPQAVEEAAFRAIGTAARLIDLDQHQGQHPRIGATDVVPFVPLHGVTLEECVAIARRLGERVGRELGIPVYLYEAAATRPERVNLENIRRGQYEALKVEMGVNPERDPDFGPKQVGPAGATVIGARPPLIAFNVYLNTDDVTVAKAIARAVRHSSGGLRYVKALGLLVGGRAQVSMNLTNSRETPLARVVELIRREAERYGTAIHHTEVVGLLPQDALLDAAIWYLQLDGLERDQILEARLLAAQADLASPGGFSAPAPTASFLDDLAAATPTPGGGSAAAFSAAMGAALVAMVAGLTIGKKKYAEVEAEMQAIRATAETLRADLTRAVQQDAAAFEALMAAYRLPKDTPEQQTERQEAIRRATLQAASVPLRVARQAVQVMDLALICARRGNVNARSDALSALALAQAALTAAMYNVRVNLRSLDEPSLAEPLMLDIQALQETAQARWREAETLEV